VEILKGLGYRAEPKPAAEVKAKLDALDTAAREAGSAPKTDGMADANGAEAAPASQELGEVAVRASSESLSETSVDVVAASDGGAAAAAAVAPLAEEEPAFETPSAVEAQALSNPAIATTTAPSRAPQTDSAPVGLSSAEPDQEHQGQAGSAQAATEEAPAAPAEEPKPILLWRQARFEGRPGQRHGGNRERGGPRGRHAQAPAGEAEGRAPRRDGGKERFDRKFQGKPGKPDGAGVRQDGRDARKPGQKGGFQGKPAFQNKPREERPVRIDPDSPFAKLAALRDQLKK
jgi:ATP-dependent RNA helicase SUPV3L1/SUV3